MEVEDGFPFRGFKLQVRRHPWFLAQGSYPFSSPRTVTDTRHFRGSLV